MGLWKIAWRYLWRQPLVTLLTILGLSLGCALISGVLTLRNETERSLVSESGLYDIVIGAKGSPLQLVLSSVYHLDVPTGNIPYEEYLKLKDDFRVQSAIPLGMGDNYQGYRIIGTTQQFFNLKQTSSDGKSETPLLTLEEGQLFSKPFEVVLGSSVAKQTGLTLGDSFIGTHGVTNIQGAENHQKFPYVVVGVLQPNGTANDRIIVTQLQSVWKVHASEEELHANIFNKPIENKLEVTAILVKLTIPAMRYMLLDSINKNTTAMGAIPINEMLRLYKKVLNPVQKTLLAVAYLVIIVSALSIITSLYQSAERRRNDIAIMRSMGAHSSDILIIVLLEAFFLTFIGVICGWFFGHLALEIATRVFSAETAINISPWATSAFELKAYLFVIVIGFAAGSVPALLHYRRSPVRDL